MKKYIVWILVITLIGLIVPYDTQAKLPSDMGGSGLKTLVPIKKDTPATKVIVPNQKSTPKPVVKPKEPTKPKEERQQQAANIDTTNEKNKETQKKKSKTEKKSTSKPTSKPTTKPTSKPSSKPNVDEAPKVSKVTTPKPQEIDKKDDSREEEIRIEEAKRLQALLEAARQSEIAKAEKEQQQRQINIDYKNKSEQLAAAHNTELGKEIVGSNSQNAVTIAKNSTKTDPVTSPPSIAPLPKKTSSPTTTPIIITKKDISALSDTLALVRKSECYSSDCTLKEDRIREELTKLNVNVSDSTLVTASPTPSPGPKINLAESLVGAINPQQNLHFSSSASCRLAGWTECVAIPDTKNSYGPSLTARNIYHLPEQSTSVPVLDLIRLGVSLINPPANQYQPSTVFVDMTDVSFQELAVQKFGNRQEVIEIVNRPDFETNWESYLHSENPLERQIALAYGIFLPRNNHDQLVLTSHDGTLVQNLVKPSKALVVPLYDAMNFNFTQDELGNTVGRVTVDEQEVARMLQTHFSQNPDDTVANLSFLIGTYEQTQVEFEYKARQCFLYHPGSSGVVGDYCLVGIPNNTQLGQRYFTPDELAGINIPDEIMTLVVEQSIPLPYFQNNGEDTPAHIIQADEYESNPELQVVETEDHTIETKEAYNADFAPENLARLVSLAQQFPDRLIVTAGGNHQDYFYQARQELTSELQQQGQDWPENLIIVGVVDTEDSSGANTNADGADIYVTQNNWIDSTSEATSVISAIADIAETQIPNHIQGEERARILRELLLNDSRYTFEGTYRGVELDDSGQVTGYTDRSTRILNSNLNPINTTGKGG